MVQQWTFRALDTLFFRDGTPYNAGEGGYTSVRSGFPPFMTTLQGAIRTNLAVTRGWRPGRPEHWPPVLGGADDLGDLRLEGPYLFVDGELYLPLPKVLVVGRQAEPCKEGFFVRLTPGPEVSCDLGVVRLPVPERACPGAGLPEGCWVSHRGMGAILNGGVPARGDTRHQDEMWSYEFRTGLKRQKHTRTAEPHMLYTCQQVRPHRGMELVVLVGGIPEGWKIPASWVTNLGGEGRLAQVTVASRGAEWRLLPPVPEIDTDRDHLRYTVTLATPGWFDYEDLQRVIREGPPGLPGRCVCACVGKAAQVGGWDLANRRPRPLISLVPAGSTWFYKTEAELGPRVKDLHGVCIGAKPDYGFGQILIGRWDES